MNELKYSGIEWIGKIPSSWNVTRSKYCFNNHKIIVGSKQDTYDRLALTMQGVIMRSKEDVDGLQPESFYTYQILKKGELVFKLIDLQNIHTSRVGLSPYTGIVSPAYIILSPQSNVFPSYAEKYFLSLWHRQIFNYLGDDGVRSSLNVTDLLNVPFILPPYKRQIDIASYLDKKCCEIDSIIDGIESEILILEKYKQCLISKTVIKGLNPNADMRDSGVDWIGLIPAYWSVKRAKYIFTQRNMKGNNKNLELLSPTQKYGVIPQSLYEEYSGMTAVKLKEDYDLTQLKTIHKGDFCISLRSYQGGFEYSNYEGVVSPAYQVFSPNTEIVDGYFKYLFKETTFIKKINSYAMSLRDGKNISFENFGKTYLPIPPLQDQAKISSFLDMKCSEIDATIENKRIQLDTLNKYKKSIIYEYVTGKKEVPST